MKAIIIIILTTLSISCFANRTITGRITNKNNEPISGARVRAYDYDLLSANDLMGETQTDYNGYYTINYESKHWDTKWPFSTTWRPNIFIKISIKVHGRCDDGEWIATAEWKNIGESSVHSNQRLSNDLTINFKADDFPTDNVEVVTFTECENKHCYTNFPFHYHCKGFYQGKETEWGAWSLNGFPYIVIRCINLETSSNIKQRDIDDMKRDCNNRVLDAYGAESGANALKESCIGYECSHLKYNAIEEKKAISIVNESKEMVLLTFKAKPFKDWKNMIFFYYLNANDSILIPSLKFQRLIVKSPKLKE